jgi:hypothetical protein
LTDFFSASRGFRGGLACAQMARTFTDRVDRKMATTKSAGGEAHTPSDTEVQFFKQLVEINWTLITIKKILLICLIGACA